MVKYLVALLLTLISYFSSLLSSLSLPEMMFMVLACFTSFALADVQDILSMERLKLNGRFDVVCQKGSSHLTYEVRSAAEIKAGSVCNTNTTSSGPSNPPLLRGVYVTAELGFGDQKVAITGDEYLVTMASRGTLTFKCNKENRCKCLSAACRSPVEELIIVKSATRYEYNTGSQGSAWYDHKGALSADSPLGSK